MSPKHAAPRVPVQPRPEPAVEPEPDVIAQSSTGGLELAVMVRQCEVDRLAERWLLAKALFALAVVAAFVLLRLAYVG